MVAGLVLGSVFLGACGNAAGPSADSAAGSPTTTTATSSMSETADAAATVEITEFAYAPKEVRIKAGETVRWVNNDEFLHTVTSGEVDGPENKADGMFDEDLDESGSEATVTFDQPGSYTYFCSQHNAMDGVVIVESN